MLVTVALFSPVPDAIAALAGKGQVRVTSELGLTWLESDIDIDGGKLYLTAGAPSSTGADEERMLRALRAILDTDSALTLRAAVNRGPAFAGDIGASARRAYAIMGDTVNLAARLTARAEAGEILATGDVLERSRTRFETIPQPFLVKGKERAITAYRVGALAGVADEEGARFGRSLFGSSAAAGRTAGPLHTHRVRGRCDHHSCILGAITLGT